MDDGERELAFCQVFTEALVVCVLEGERVRGAERERERDSKEMKQSK